MNTPENRTTRIDGKPVAPQREAAFDEGAIPFEDGAPGATPPEENFVTKLEDEVAKLRDQALRDRADLENTRKRLQREKEESKRYANSALLENLLPVVDNFELGLMAARNSPDASGILNGMNMVQKQLEDFLRAEGMIVIDSVGHKFDPNLHEALGEENSDEFPEGIVVRQLRKGYKLKDRLLRPANVFVSKGKAG